MKKEYDFSKMNFTRNPYAKLLKKQISIRLDADVLEYFKRLAKDTEVSYQTLINWYLKDCARAHRKPVTRWAA